MSGPDKKTQLDLWLSVMITLVLLMTSVIILYLCQVRFEDWFHPSKDWALSVSSGLAVLGIAGIWVSFLAQRRLQGSISRTINDSFSIVKSIMQMGIDDIYYDALCDGSSYSEDERSRYHKDLKAEIGRAQGEIRILGIALRDFFHLDRDIFYGMIKSLIESKRVRPRVLLLHPWSEQGISRAFHEQADDLKELNQYDNSQLYHDITVSCQTILRFHLALQSVPEDHTQTNKPSEDLDSWARLYTVLPAYFLVFVNDVVFVEHYGFGSGGRASGKVPLFKIHSGTNYYNELQAHFEWVWKTANPVTKDVISDLGRGSSAVPNFLSTINFLRPDIHA